MHADATFQRDADEELATPVLMALALHAAIVALLLLAGWWQPSPTRLDAAGPPIEASLVITAADVATAEDAIEQLPKPEPVQADPMPQPVPEPIPQDAPDELQPTPQEMLPEPDTVDQEAVARMAAQAAEEARREEQERRIRQEQIDLTERERQAEAERRQRRLEQLEAIQRERAEARRRADLEQQRLEQLAEAQAARRPETREAPPGPQAGNDGTSDDLLSRYLMALHQTANASWNRSLAPEATPCKVRFTQIPPGEVIRVEFLDCPFDAAARESVERALLRGHMPYDGFQDVFTSPITLTFCYPEEACPR